MFKPCVIIPVYNHEKPLAGVVERVRAFGLPCLLVDDGSAEPCADLVRGLAERDPGVQCFRHAANRGKGGAMKTGLLAARELGYTHAVQIDADGQHDTGDLGRFLELARANPGAVVAGEPVFDESVPKVRYYARYLTHVWVWINTLSFTIRDALCGFRVYPVEACARLVEAASLGERMEFDVEILVRLYWQGVPILSLPTRVNYPQDGVSHFRLWEDNARLSLLQARLFFSLPLRLPGLLRKALR